MIWYDMIWYDIWLVSGWLAFNCIYLRDPHRSLLSSSLGWRTHVLCVASSLSNWKCAKMLATKWGQQTPNSRQCGGYIKGGGGSEETVWGLWEGGVIGSAGSKCFYCCCCSKLNWGAHVFACLYSKSYSYSYSLFAFVIRIRYSLAHSLLLVRIHSSCKIVGGSTKRRTKRSPKDINKWAKAARAAK